MEGLKKFNLEAVPLTDAELKDIKMPSNTEKSIKCPDGSTLACPPGYVQGGIILEANGSYKPIGIICNPAEEEQQPRMALYCDGYGR